MNVTKGSLTAAIASSNHKNNNNNNSMPQIAQDTPPTQNNKLKKTNPMLDMRDNL